MAQCIFLYKRINYFNRLVFIPRATKGSSRGLTHNLQVICAKTAQQTNKQKIKDQGQMETWTVFNIKFWTTGKVLQFELKSKSLDPFNIKSTLSLLCNQ